MIKNRFEGAVLRTFLLSAVTALWLNLLESVGLLAICELSYVIQVVILHASTRVKNADVSWGLAVYALLAFVFRITLGFILVPIVIFFGFAKSGWRVGPVALGVANLAAFLLPAALWEPKLGLLEGLKDPDPLVYLNQVYILSFMCLVSPWLALTLRVRGSVLPSIENAESEDPTETGQETSQSRTLNMHHSRGQIERDN